jgi:hypothetical protein
MIMSLWVSPKPPIAAEPSANSGSIFLTRPTSFTIAGKNSAAVSISLETGAVTLGKGYTPDAAAKEFWAAVSRMFPGSLKP